MGHCRARNCNDFALTTVPIVSPAMYHWSPSRVRLPVCARVTQACQRACNGRVTMTSPAQICFLSVGRIVSAARQRGVTSVTQRHTERLSSAKYHGRWECDEGREKTHFLVSNGAINLFRTKCDLWN